jgi:hypothetical protein
MNGIPLKKALRFGADLQTRNDGLIEECSAMRSAADLQKHLSGRVFYAYSATEWIDNANKKIVLLESFIDVALRTAMHINCKLSR